MLVTHSLAVWRRTNVKPQWSGVSTDWIGLKFSWPHTSRSDSAPPECVCTCGLHIVVASVGVKKLFFFFLSCSTVCCCYVCERAELDLWWPLWKHLDLGRGKTVGVKVCQSSFQLERRTGGEVPEDEQEVIHELLMMCKWSQTSAPEAMWKCVQCSFILAGGIHQVKSMFQYQILSYCEHHESWPWKVSALLLQGKGSCLYLDS